MVTDRERNRRTPPMTPNKELIEDLKRSLTFKPSSVGGEEHTEIVERAIKALQSQPVTEDVRERVLRTLDPALMERMDNYMDKVRVPARQESERHAKIKQTQPARSPIPHYDTTRYLVPLLIAADRLIQANLINHEPKEGV